MFAYQECGVIKSYVLNLPDTIVSSKHGMLLLPWHPCGIGYHEIIKLNKIGNVFRSEMVTTMEEHFDTGCSPFSHLYSLEG